MLNFYTYTFVQLGAQLLVLFITFMQIFQKKGGKIARRDANHVKEFCLWFGLFSMWGYLSLRWCVYGASTETNTLLTMFRIFVMGMCIVYDISSRDDLEHFIYLFVISGVIFALLTLVSNSPSNWGKESFKTFDKGYMRNGVANFSMFFLAFVVLFEKLFTKRQTKCFCILFLGLILLCGSRRTILLLLLFVLFYVFTMNGARKKIKTFTGLAIVGIILLLIASNIPYIQNTYISRIAAMFSGTQSSDGSTVGRTAYIIIGWGMFLKRPWFGWGVDAFYNHILRNPYAFRSDYHLQALYSHNNYIEVLTSFGLVGAVIYYKEHLQALIISIKNKQNDLARFVLILTMINLIGDYGGIVFSSHVPMYFLIFIFSASKIVKDERKNNAKEDSCINS